MDDVLVGKVTISASLKKNHFPKISDQAPLIWPNGCWLAVRNVLTNYYRINATNSVMGKELIPCGQSKKVFLKSMEICSCPAKDVQITD